MSDETGQTLAKLFGVVAIGMMVGHHLGALDGWCAGFIAAMLVRFVL